MADTLKILEVRIEERGGLVLSVEHDSGGHKVHKQINVAAKDLTTIESASDPAVALETWLKERFPGSPTWAAALVGTTITL
jgi:hypothetical protein